jgi:hypothetical protein
MLCAAPSSALRHGCRPCRALLARTAAPRADAASRTTMALAGPVFFLDDFAIRQWDDPGYSGTRMRCARFAQTLSPYPEPHARLSSRSPLRQCTARQCGVAWRSAARRGAALTLCVSRRSCDKADFMARLQAAHAAGSAPLVDGYAPFCKHVFVPNFAGARCGALRITPQNASLLRSGYGARTANELPVLQRWFPEAAVSPVPVRYAREMGADVVLAIDISSRPEDAKTSDVLKVLLQTFSIMGKSISQLELAQADVVVRPALPDVGSAEFSARKKSIEAGRAAMKQALPQLKALLAP